MGPPAAAAQGLAQNPICLALVLARQVYCDPGSGALTISEPYWYLAAEEFPATYASGEVYAVLTACQGDVFVEIRLADALDARPPVFRQVQSTHFDDPADVRELVFRQVAPTFPQDDEYRLQLYVYGPGINVPGMPGQGTGVPILERRLIVAQA
jgi:hypothetical protein